MPNVFRRFLALTARVPIIHAADTAFTTGGLPSWGGTSSMTWKRRAMRWRSSLSGYRS